MKKTKIFICLTLLLAVVLSTISIGATADFAYALGDVNDDSNINAIDTLNMQYYISKIDNNIDVDCADVNCDGNIDLIDILYLKQYCAKIITDFKSHYVGGPLETIDDLDASPYLFATPGAVAFSAENDDSYSARNIWDMSVYNDKLFVGMGCYEPNMGPVPVYYYTKDNAQRHVVGTLYTEEVGKFFNIGRQLYTTSVDAVNWLTGQFYAYNESTKKFTTYSQLNNNVHCYDMVKYDGKIFFAGSYYNYFDGILADIGCVAYRSADNLTSSSVSSKIVPFYKNGVALANNQTYRSYNMYVFNDQLYAVHASSNVYAGLYKYDKEQCRFNFVNGLETENSICSIYGNTTDYIYSISDGTIKVSKKTYVKGLETVYSEQQCTNMFTNDAGQLVAVCNDIFLSNDGENFAYASLGFDYADYVIRDAKKICGKYYFVGSKLNSDGTYTNAVFETADFSNFRRVLHFNTSAFIRSFEYMSGSFYFGTGTYMKNDSSSVSVNKDSGQIYRLDLFKN